MKITRYTSKESIEKLESREIDIHRFLEISSIEKGEGYSWEEDEINLIPFSMIIENIKEE